jgi:H/ACA ribonucleoprotein complex subunit 4
LSNIQRWEAKEVMTTLAGEEIAKQQREKDYSIKPESTTPKLDTSQWPLLLKNYDTLIARTAHYTHIPMGCSPLKRDLQSYIK